MGRSWKPYRISMKQQCLSNIPLQNRRNMTRDWLMLQLLCSIWNYWEDEATNTDSNRSEERKKEGKILLLLFVCFPILLWISYQYCFQLPDTRI
jgi:hypothetical protein